MFWDTRVDASKHLTIKACHVVSSEGWPKCDWLVQDAAKWPYVTLHVVRLVAPNFGTSIIRRTRLSVKKTSLGNLGNIHIAEFGSPIFVQKYIGTFQISVKNVGVVKGLQTLDNLDKDTPDIFFTQVGLLFLVSCNFLEKISIIGKLHDYTRQKKGRKSKLIQTL